MKCCLICSKKLLDNRSKHCKKCRQTGELNNGFKGSEAGLGAIHAWVKRRLSKPDICADCKQPKPLDLANISQTYKRELDDWEWLCRKCHMNKDWARIRKNKKTAIEGNSRFV